MQSMKKRVYESIGGGYAVEAPYVQDEQGQKIPYACDKQKKGVPVPVSVLKSKGLPIMESKNVAEMQNERMPVGVGFSEKPGGAVDTYRSESPDDGTGRKVLRIKIDNGEGTEEKIILGDPTGLIKQQLGIGAPKGGVTFAGSYGADTYTILQNMTGLIPFDLHTIKFQGETTAGAASDAFFNAGRFGLVKLDVAGNTPSNEELVLSDLVQPSTFQTNIRKDDSFRFQLQAATAFEVTLPAGEAVLITATISAAGFTRMMNKLY